MKNRKAAYFSISFLILLLFCIVLIVNSLNAKKSEVIFFDVGQGDAVLIKKGNFEILIDGGSDGSILLEKLGKYVPFWDRHIEVVVATHPDQDHIGGLNRVFESYMIGSVFETNEKKDSQTVKKFEKLIEEKRILKIIAEKNQIVSFPSGETLTILHPPKKNHQNGDTNAASIVSLFNAGKTTFLLTGDLPSEQEKELIEEGIDMKADILKVAHHGSKYSTSEAFLNAVSPKEAIISVGSHNTYGHPNKETVDRLKNKNTQIRRTDEQGDIIYACPNFDEECFIQ